MKFARQSNNRQNKQGLTHRPMPEIRDDMDSRHDLEQHKKGEHTTNNFKNKRSSSATKNSK